jgi:hypothetical protein
MTRESIFVSEAQREGGWCEPSRGANRSSLRAVNRKIIDLVGFNGISAVERENGIFVPVECRATSEFGW